MFSLFSIALIISFFFFLFERESFFSGWHILGGLSVGGLILFLALNRLLEINTRLTIDFQAIFCFIYFLVFLFMLGLEEFFFHPMVYLFLIIGSLFSLPMGVIFFLIPLALLFLIHPFSETVDLFRNNEIRNLAALSLVFIVSITMGFIFRQAIKEKQGSASKCSDEKEGFQASLLTNIGDGIYAINSNREIIFFNKEAERITGWKSSEVLGLSCQKIMNIKNDQSKTICVKDCPALAVWCNGGKVIKDNMFITNKRNVQITIEGSYTPIREANGKITGAICVFRDVTKKKEAERLKSEFVAVAAHELRTPITAILGYIELVLNPSICQINEKAKEFLTKAYETSNGMSHLINNLLIISKIDNKRIEPNITSFSIRDLIKEVMEVFQNRADEKKLKLNLENSADITFKGRAIGRALKVRADKEQVREALNNLIENAIKFTAKGGVEIFIKYDREFATVSIEDSGVGIPQEDQKHLFGKFYRANSAATKNFKGSGLGLYITRSIIEGLGGRIWLESKENVGTKFYFTLPLTKE